jgi:hypothetical protein
MTYKMRVQWQNKDSFSDENLSSPGISELSVGWILIGANIPPEHTRRTGVFSKRSLVDWRDLLNVPAHTWYSEHGI